MGERVDRVLDVAVTGVDIDQAWQVRHREDVAHAGRDFPEPEQADIGNAIARTDNLKASDHERVEASLLDNPRRQRIVRTGRHEGRLLCGELAKGLCVIISGGLAGGHRFLRG